MILDALKSKWLNNYKTAPEQLNKMARVKGVISAFNVNIDAVIKINGAMIEKIIAAHSLDQNQILEDGKKRISLKEDAIRGIIHCFKSGIAEEWLIRDKEMFFWLNENIGYDKMQMGGQGGIVANAMAVCGVDPVYVHCASLPKDQAKQFLNLPNLVTVDEDGKIAQAYTIERKADLPLIHWIIEFNAGDSVTIAGKQFTCPKANRFIATYDPLNFKLYIDETFAEKMAAEEVNHEYIILSGYQILTEYNDEGTSGIDRVDASKKIIQSWYHEGKNSILHLEVASTQDKTIRKYLLDNIAKNIDSVGFNERELIDILEVIDQHELAGICNKNTNSKNLFKGMLKIFEYLNCSRMQLHMFGLYITLQRKGFKISPVQNRNGMQLAAVIAAAKAGTGAIDSADILLWAKDREVSEVGLNELNSLAEYVATEFGENNLIEEGIFANDEIEIVAVPTIIIDKPLTLVGMGDTISSISLVGAR
ncbi:MAG: ADP-dependent glucokinase/phosphofructokinase [Bacteroidota bacterium]|nr:ADP-dependent glucokinase/phosphofructokinase [Bacteroidota bacterium]